MPTNCEDDIATLHSRPHTCSVACTEDYEMTHKPKLSPASIHRKYISLFLSDICGVRGLVNEESCAFRYRKPLISVKVHPVHALRLCTGRTAHRGSRGIALAASVF